MDVYKEKILAIYCSPLLANSIAPLLASFVRPNQVEMQNVISHLLHVFPVVFFHGPILDVIVLGDYAAP